MSSNLQARALVFVNGRNCASYVTAALESLVWQTHARVHVLFVDDCSDDPTATLAAEFLHRHFPDRHTLVRNPSPMGKAYNAHAHLRNSLHAGDFVAILDADDQLNSATALSDLAREYDAGFDVVWTNYETDAGAIGSNGPLDPLRPPRGQGWKTSHLFSFRAELFAAVPEEYLQDDRGDWLPAACDFAIAYPVLDQTRRYRYLPVRAYRYTATNPASHHNQDPQAIGLNSQRQRRCARLVLDRPPLPCRRWLFGEHAAADHAISLWLQRLMTRNDDRTAPPTVVAPAADDERNTWQLTAAATLQARCPGLLNLSMDGNRAPLPVGTLWRWWRWLQHGPAQPRVLAIGAGSISAELHALVDGLGGQLTTLTADREAAEALYVRLHSAGYDSSVIHAPLVDAAFDDFEGRFPDLRSMQSPEALYDAVIVAADSGARGTGDAVLALPMVAPMLDATQFRVCLWAPDNGHARDQALNVWRNVAPDLVYVNHALAGSSLVVHAH